MVLNKSKQQRGFSLVEVVVVSALMLLVFGGLLISFRYSLELISHSRAKLTALTLANDNMEYIRSLSYNAVGTVSGIPSGMIPQVSTTTLNGIIFTKRVLVEYIDDDADGLGIADSNGITTDYKQAKVTLEWTLRGVTKEVFLVSSIIPKSIETDVDGGTVRVNVFDFGNVPLPGASVRLINTTLSPNIDVTRASDASGIALFGGAPKGGNYEIIVTAPGYSTDQTYVATTTLPNPTTQPIAVVESGISTMNFFIDELSSIDISALASKVTNQFTENFSNVSGIATSTAVAVASNSLRLQGTAGTYSLSGTANLQSMSPSPVSNWEYAVIAGTKSNATNVLARFYTVSSTVYTLIPDSDLPGNSAGFAFGKILLTNLSVITYPAITLGLTLSSANVNETPIVNSVVVGYVESKTPFANQTLTFTGNKNIGTLADSSLVYKTILTPSTNAQGEVTIAAIEADDYKFTTTGYEVAEMCPMNGLTIEPSTTFDLELVMLANTPHSLRIGVETASGLPVIGAQIKLSRSGYNVTKQSTGCGQVYFSGIAADTDYQIDITAPGYTSQTINNVTVNQDSVQIITL